MMIKRAGWALATAAALSVWTSGDASAQMPDTAAAAESREHMDALDWMVGEWEGEGWIMVRGAGRQSFTSSEVVEPRLDGRILLVEGLHHDDAGGVVHHALGAITWDANDDAYVFHTWLGNEGGGGADNPLERTDTGFRWMPGTSNSEATVVFDVRHENDEWIETGTVTLADGRTFPFFEMRLRRME